MFYAILVLVPVYFIKHSVSCYNYVFYINDPLPIPCNNEGADASVHGGTEAIPHEGNLSLQLLCMLAIVIALLFLV